MKAVVLREVGGPQNLRIEVVDSPLPGLGEVRVALKTAALNRRDVWITVGAYPRIQFPSISGSDGAGVIDRVGPDIDESMVAREVVIYPARDWGDDPRCGGPEFRVLGMPDQGTLAEYICVPAGEVFDRPEHLSWEQAAACPLAGLTAWRAVVTHGEVRAGHKVLVTGIGGGVATFALLWATRHGAEVYVTSSGADKIEAAVRLGATAGVNYTDGDWPKQIRKLSGGIDLVIDSAGGAVVNQAIATLNPGGRFVFFGATSGDPPKGLEMAKIFFRQIRIQGTTMGTLSEFGDMLDFVAKQEIEPVVDRVFSIDDAVAAHQRLLDCEQMGKIVLTIAS